MKPEPTQSVANPDLWRPDWTSTETRDRSKLWLDKNENSDPALADIVRRVVADLPIDSLCSYPETGELYQKLAGLTGVPAENLLLAAGSDGAIRSVFEAYMNPGDIVVHTSPTFAMYAVYGQIYGSDCRPLAYRPSNNGPVLTAEDVVAAIAEADPKLVCLPNPDSPTGTVFSTDEMRTIIEAAGRSGALMLVDEAYYPFHDETVLPWVMDYDHLVVTRSTGKAWGLAGFRIGYCAASREIIGHLHKVRGMYETNNVAATVFEAMLDREADMQASVERLERGKAQFLAAMRELGFQTLNGKGNFLHVAFGAQASKIHQALDDLAYYRKDFNDPCLRGFSRFSATTPELFAPLITRIKEAIEQ